MSKETKCGNCGKELDLYKPETIYSCVAGKCVNWGYGTDYCKECWSIEDGMCVKCSDKLSSTKGDIKKISEKLDFIIDMIMDNKR